MALFQLLKPVSRNVLFCHLEKVKRPCFLALRQLAQNSLYPEEQLSMGTVLFVPSLLDLSRICLGTFSSAFTLM